MKFYLDKVSLIGGIDDNTPLCVIEELCICCGIEDASFLLSPLNRVITSLIKMKKVTIDTDTDEDEFTSSEMARFVNPREKAWNYYTLITAFNSIYYFNPATFTSSKEFGFKTHFQPNSVDICMCYSLLRHYSLSHNRETSFDEMISMIKSFDFDQYRSYGSVPQFEDSRTLETIYSSIRSNNIYSYLLPASKREAILFSSVAFNLDISESNDPIEDYFRRRRSGPSDFHPKCESFRKKYLTNSYFYTISKFWNPQFYFLYSDSDIINLAVKEGYPRGEILNKEDAYLSLTESRRSYTFYYGKHPNSEESSAILAEDLAERSNNECISFANYYLKEFYTFTFEELIEFYSSRRILVNVVKPRELLSSTQLRKLDNVLSTYDSPISDEFKNLISEIRKSQRNLSESEIGLKNIFSSSSVEEKEAISKSLHLLLNAAMRMRGWGVSCENYPLTSDECNGGDANKIDDLTFAAIEEFENFTESVGTTELMRKLTIFDYREGNFAPVIDEDQGRNIGERIDIVKSGGFTDSVYSCIRLSSNVFCATAFKYLTGIGEEEPFDIKKMRLIG